MNEDGFEVDVIRRAATNDDPHPLRMTSDEFWAAQVSSGAAMQDGWLIEQPVIGLTGEMAVMCTIAGSSGLLTPAQVLEVSTAPMNRIVQWKAM